MNNHPIIIERIFNVPAAKVWEAITDKNKMRKWYFDLPDFNAKTGFKFQFTGGPSPERQYLHLCEVTEVIHGKKLSYSWRYDGYPGNSFVTFDLFEKGHNTTLLKLTHKDIETFSSENVDFAKENFVEGWDEIVNVSLKEYLEPSKNH